MIKLNVLSGNAAGTSLVARRFPVRMGRAEVCELRLEDAGVWDQHARVCFKPGVGFSFKTEPNALARLNGQSVSETLLRNGDTVELGAARIQFWLSPVRQRSLGFAEAWSWAMIAAITLSQIEVLYWLLE